MFTISTEPHRWLVRIKITGMLSVQDITDLYREEHEAIRAMGCPLGEQLVLVDGTECPLQFQEVVVAFQRFMDSPAKARRLAIVADSPLARMQARRIVKREDASVFATSAEAERWLFPNAALHAA